MIKITKAFVIQNSFLMRIKSIRLIPTYKSKWFNRYMGLKFVNCIEYTHSTSNLICTMPSCEYFGYFLQPNINQAVIILRFAICIVLITSKTIYVPLVA